MFGRKPTIPLDFYASELDKWVDERRELINRIQHPTVFPVKQVAQPLARPMDLPPTDDEELAKVGTIELGREELGKPPAPTNPGEKVNGPSV